MLRSKTALCAFVLQHFVMHLLEIYQLCPTGLTVQLSLLFDSCVLVISEAL